MKKYFTLAIVAAIAFACKKEDPKPASPAGVLQGSGVVITNEGAFTGGTGTVSFYKPDDMSVGNDLFMTANNVPIGNVLQSVTHANNALYFVLNGAEKIVVAHENTLKQQAEITGFASPRYMTVVSPSKAYVTNWITNDIKIVDLNTNSITGSIPCGSAPERMAFNGSHVYVANSGGFGKDSTVFVIDVANDQVVDTVYTGFNPNSLVLDANGHLWILCAGISDWSDPTNDVPGKLMKVDPTGGNTVMLDLDFPNKSDHPADLTIDGSEQNIYWLSNDYAGSVFTMSRTDNMLPPVAQVQGAFYGLGVDPQSGEIYTSDAKDYQSNGVVYRHQSNGTVMDSATVGLIPNSFLFK